jgi:hypothetical protein
MPGDEHWEFAFTIPAGTAKATPVRNSMAIGVRKLVGVSWMIPQGPSGALGWYFSMGGVQVIPVNSGAWLIRDGNADGSELSHLPDSGAWQLTAYNTGTFPHTIYVTLYASVIRTAPPPPPSPLSLDAFQPGIASVPVSTAKATP